MTAFPDSVALGPAALAAGAADNPAVPVLIEKLAAYEVTDNREFVAALRQNIRTADDQGRAAIEAALLAVLNSDKATLAGRQAAGDLLREVAGKASVPVLAGLLLDEKLSHTARTVLEATAASEAIAALSEALPRAKGRIRVGIFDSLSRRGGAKAVDRLPPQLLKEIEEEARRQRKPKPR